MATLTLGGNNLEVNTTRENQPETVRVGYAGVYASWDYLFRKLDGPYELHLVFGKYARAHGFDDYVFAQARGSPLHNLDGPVLEGIEVFFFRQDVLKTIDPWVLKTPEQILEYIKGKGNVPEFSSLDDLPDMVTM